MSTDNERVSDGEGQSAPEGKAERFERVATARVKRVADAIRVLSNCGNRSTYLYNEDQVERMFKFLEEQLREAKSKFRCKPSERPDFRF